MLFRSQKVLRVACKSRGFGKKPLKVVILDPTRIILSHLEFTARVVGSMEYWGGREGYQLETREFTNNAYGKGVISFL